MRVSLILGHPREGSLSHAIADAAADQLSASGHAVSFHDLQAEGFDPVMTGEELITRVSKNELVERHCHEIAEADGLVVVHPNWWGGPPAIVKGWIDRVIRPGVAYSFEPAPAGGMRWVGLLRVRAVAVFNTATVPAGAETSRFGDTLNGLWKNHVAALCVLPVLERHVFGGMPESTQDVRDGWLSEVRGTVSRLFPPG